MRRWSDALRALALAASVSIAACGVLDRAETALIEEFGASGIGADRSWAMRLTVLEFGDEVGGFVEYFQLDGIYNTPEQPYVVATECSYFGPVPNLRGGVRVVADGVDAETPLVMQLTWETPRQNAAEAVVERDGGLRLLENGTTSLRWTRDTAQRPERRCSRASSVTLESADVGVLHDTGSDR